jgi:cysteine desulfurase
MARMTPIYLDHAATTPMLPAVADAVREASLRYGANPASQHELGRQARRALEAARERIAEILGAGPDDQLIFTSGGTESNNLAITGLQKRAGSSPTRAGASPPRLVISPLEHPSVSRLADHLATLGWHVDRLPVTPAGAVRVDDFDDLARRLTSDVRLVSVMLGSNETGVLQPIYEIGEFCRARGIPLHVDAVQAVGKLPVNFGSGSIDALTFTAHKFHGPVGIGALLLRSSVVLDPSLHGGFQQAALRPGTENVALAIGMQVALEAWRRETDLKSDRMTTLRDELDRAVLASDWRAVRINTEEWQHEVNALRDRHMTALRDALERAILTGDPRAVVIGAEATRLPHISNIAFCGLDRQALAMALDLEGVACSTGSACASGSSEPSPALIAMGLWDEQISSSMRFSVGATTTRAEIDEASRRILSVVNRLRRG